METLKTLEELEQKKRELELKEEIYRNRIGTQLAILKKTRQKSRSPALVKAVEESGKLKEELNTINAKLRTEQRSASCPPFVENKNSKATDQRPLSALTIRLQESPPPRICKYTDIPQFHAFIPKLHSARRQKNSLLGTDQTFFGRTNCLYGMTSEQRDVSDEAGLRDIELFEQNFFDEISQQNGEAERKSVTTAQSFNYEDQPFFPLCLEPTEHTDVPGAIDCEANSSVASSLTTDSCTPLVLGR